MRQGASIPSTDDIQQKLQLLADRFQGRVGIGVQGKTIRASIHGKQRFGLQSVMKLIVAATVLDAVDRRGWHLREDIIVHRSDLSLNVQPLADLVTPEGFHTTIGDLLERAVIQSDSAATDILFARVGGSGAIQKFLKSKNIMGIRVDRDERHLQTEIVGLTWRPAYVDAALLNRAKQAVSEKKKDAAYLAYRKDERDTATPDGMVAFLGMLATGRLLSPWSTQYLLQIMQKTITFPDRLKAGTPSGWIIGHKTGTSHTWKGVTAVTNDAGILTAPDNGRIAIAVFIADSHLPPKANASLIAEVAHIVTNAYSFKKNT